MNSSEWLTNFFGISICAEMLALVAALVLVPVRQSRYGFILACCILISIEAELGRYMLASLALRGRYIFAFYNVTTIVNPVLYATLFFRFISPRAMRMMLLLLLTLFIAFVMIEGVHKSFSRYLYINDRLAFSFIELFCLIFYFSIIRDETIQNPLKYAPFWIVTGLFIYYAGFIALVAFYDWVLRVNLTVPISFNYLVVGLLNCILYGSWIIGFICMKNQFRSSRV